MGRIQWENRNYFDAPFKCSGRTWWGPKLSKARLWGRYGRDKFESYEEKESTDFDCWREKNVIDDNSLSGLEMLLFPRKKNKKERENGFEVSEVSDVF